jgi:hypothetical protein
MFNFAVSLSITNRGAQALRNRDTLRKMRTPSYDHPSLPLANQEKRLMH